MYEHDEKRLVSKDLGATLRHEFMHVLHHRDMQRLGQRHPIWIQEGLASLIEDYDRAGGAPGDTLEPGPSWRTNITKRLADARRAKSLRELAADNGRRFGAVRPLAEYAQVRTLFLYLYEQGKLWDWYDVYTVSGTHGYAVDPSGLSAIEAVFDLELPAFEAAYFSWVRDELPETPQEESQLAAVLGISLLPGRGDGPEVRRLPPGARARTGLRLGDVIRWIDGQPVRDEAERIRRLDGLEPGDEVTIGYRRSRLTGETVAKLIETPPHPLENRNPPQAPPIGIGR